MSYKFETMLNILNRLNSGERITRTDMAREFLVTVRTIDRYIDTLRNAGFPIDFDKQRGTYAFGPGYSLRKAELSPGEHLAFGLAKSMVGKFGPQTVKALESVEQKASLRQSSLPAHIVFSPEALPPVVEEHLETLNRAIEDQRRVEMVYHAAYRGGEPSCRIVDPYYLYFVGNVWYLRAFCRLKKELRLFALDRIGKLTILGDYFIPDPDITPGSDLEHSFGAMFDGAPREVVLRFGRECVPYLERHKLHGKQQEKVLPDGRLEVRATVSSLIGLRLWLYRFIPFVEVVKPKELRDDLREELEKAVGRL